MNRPGLTRCAVSSLAAVALCLSPLACKSTDKPKEGGDAEADPKAVAENAKGEVADSPDGKVKAADADSDPDPVADVAGASADPTETAKLEYGVEVVALLDMLPEGSDEFALLRDANAAIDIYDTLVGSHLDSLKPLLAATDSVAGLAMASMSFNAMRAEMAKKVIDVEKGMLFAVNEEALIYAADDPNAFLKLMRAMGASESEGPKHCVAPKGLPGYVACGDDKDKLEGIEAGGNGRAHLDKVEAALPDVDIDRANVVGSIMTDDGHIAFTATMAAGALHITMAAAGATKEIGNYLAASEAPALGLLDPGSAFVWASVGVEGLKSQIDEVPFPFSGTAKTLTGEVFFGGLSGVGGLAMLAGVTDPFPASGLVALGGTQLGALPKSLADGTTIKVTVDDVDAGEKKVSTLHAVFGDSANVKQLEALGLVAEAFAFSAGNYVSVTLGADAKVVGQVATYDGKTATAESTAGLPGALAKAIKAGKVAYAVHLPLDAVQTAAVRDYFVTSMKAMPAEQLGGMDPEKLSQGMVSAVGPFSSLSTWLTHPNKERVMHFVVQGFGDVASEEGRAANDAVIAVAGGAPAKATYAALAKKFSSSPAAARYKQRTGETTGSDGSAMTSAFVLGLLAGVSVPAFNRYIGRSGAAVDMVEARPPVPK